MKQRFFLCVCALLYTTGLLLCLPGYANGDAWFEELKQTADDETLYKVLYAMPKGGDLHIHLSGSIHPEWLLQLALDAQADGYTYYTKVRINECAYGTNEYGGDAYLLLFKNIPHFDYEQLSECRRGEYVALQDLNKTQRAAWLDSLRLDQLFEGRNEFFEAHWSRISGLLRNPHIMAETIYLNMQHFGAEGVRYIEGQVPLLGFQTSTGEPVDPEQVREIYVERVNRKDARDTGVTIRFQLAVLRFHPRAEELLRMYYAFVAKHPEFVAVNLVGREDNDKGYPLRFLDVLRDMRRTHAGVRLSFHAGEVDEPNQHVRDTLLLGADRIGHGINLISDADTMRLMRHGPYLVEINLVSNLLLEYVGDYQQHPFPEYLRIGIPVALSTDDRGMWDSNLTDEFFVAVREFGLSWEELVTLSRNSLSHAFAPAALREQMLEDLDTRLRSFTGKIATRPASALAGDAISYGFTCRRYQLCDW